MIIFQVRLEKKSEVVPIDDHQNGYKVRKLVQGRKVKGTGFVQPREVKVQRQILTSLLNSKGGYKTHGNTLFGYTATEYELMGEIQVSSRICLCDIV